MRNPDFALEGPPSAWERLGPVMERGTAGEFDATITGDPCIVWDSARGTYHMFYFAQSPSGSSNGHAVSRSASEVGPGAWRKLGPLTYANPEALLGQTHKPWVMQDPYRPNIPATIDGEYWLFTVSFRGMTKVIQVATSASLDGPWRVRPGAVLDVGPREAFDGYHVDTVTAYWFAERAQILLFFKGYPREPQPDQPLSPFGSSNAAAVMRPGDAAAEKLGKVIAPASQPGHWAAGWVGGLQVLPARQGGWYGLINASPTPPAPVEDEGLMREPPPSQGGWAYTRAAWPVSGWQVAEQPIEWVRDLPPAAIQAGERVNLWRHHLLVFPSGELYLYYNSGAYGQERMFVRRARLALPPAR